LAPRECPEISSRACLCLSPRPRHHTQRWLTNQRLILLHMSCLKTPKAGSGPTNFRAEPSLARSSAISLPRTPACPGIQYSTRVRDTIQSLLALLDQWRRCSDSLESFQSRLTIRADTHVFLWSILKLIFIKTQQDTTYLSLKDCSISS